MSGSGKAVIFISYSQKDRPWLDYVRSFFEPLAEQCDLQTWDDEQLLIGSDWRHDIYAALDACQVFIVLVSRYSLASKFVLNVEIPRILNRPKGEVTLCPIVVTPYYSRKLDWLEDTGRRPRGDKTLLELPDPARDREMAEIAAQIDGILQSSPRRAEFEIARRAAPADDAKERVRFPSIVDYGRLPETPYKKLVGRDGELAQLDARWEDDKTHIISLVAWGGAGKTSLVIEWLTRLRDDGYRGASAVLCWSFFSQGTSSARAASGDGFLDWALGKLRIESETTSSAAKGERLAEEFVRRRILLVLDGLEPLQFGTEGQRGALKDQGVRAFLRGLAIRQPAAGHSLVVLTSRLAVRDLAKWENSTAPMIDLARLSPEAGAALLADRGVKGAVEELRQASKDFGGHALALSLLAGYLRQSHGGDAGQRARIRAAGADDDGTGHDEPRRVIEAFHDEWLVREPQLLAIMNMIGLFDRPASAGCVWALRGAPAIPDFNEAVVGLDDGAWRKAVAQLRAVRLLDPEDASAPDSLDAHPLIREWFGARLKEAGEAAWKAAHGRLFDHLLESTTEGETPTLGDLAPLYQAIAHGCQAGRYQEAVEKVYRDRICRRNEDGSLIYYSNVMLGAASSNLSALSWFFDRTYAAPTAALSVNSRQWVLSEVAFYLRSGGRIPEAWPLLQSALKMSEDSEDWKNASINAANLSIGLLFGGEIASALRVAEQAILYADRADEEYVRIVRLLNHAGILHNAGERDRAEQMFVAGELRWQQELQQSIVYSFNGFLYGDLLVAKGDWQVAAERAKLTWTIAHRSGWLLDEALDSVTMARAHLGLAWQSPEDPGIVSGIAGHFTAAIDGLRAAGESGFLPLGFLARSAFRRCIGDWDGATRDLDETEEIAVLGPMKLVLCDAAMERARLAFARAEAFAPLNGRIGKSPPAPRVPGAEERARLIDQAREHLSVAADYIASCGYHRRDEELAELQAVLRGERTFADLPPRV